MSRSLSLSLSTLVLVAAVPLAWVACGGSKPPATPADESNADSGTAATGDDSSTSASAAPADSSTPAPASTADAPPPPPPPPSLGSTDCGKCIDKTCSKQVASCGKNPDCQSTLDGIHNCGSDTGAAACISGATAPATAKPKKLAAAYETCAKKAVAKACKAKCQ